MATIKHMTGTHSEPDLAGENALLHSQIADLLREQNAVLVAHYYTDAEIQQVAEQTGGYVSDSLDMARFGNSHNADTIVVAGVRFMGETAKILNPEKRILMPDLEATCSLDIGCPISSFSQFCDQYPDRTVVVYANTSAEVKARADWVVTSSIAEPVIRHLHERGEKILWAPDKHLGSYIQRQTGADMLLWDGACIIHESFKAEAIVRLKKKHPDAAVLVHPESPQAVIDLADVVGSTTQLITAAGDLKQKIMIVATDNGILYKMKQTAPDKIFIEAPTAGIGATCESCAHCQWMAMNTLQNLVEVLKKGHNEISVPVDIQKAALVSTQRMLDFAEQLKSDQNPVFARTA